MKKYLISGIPPSHGGVGYLMETLQELAKENDCELIFPTYKNKSIKNILNPFFILSELFKRYLSKRSYTNKLLQIKDSYVVLIHPQTMGYRPFLKLIENNTKVKNYIMDNSFFCVKSYNLLDGKECLQCLNNLNNCDDRCLPFPVKYKKNDNISFLKKYEILAKKIHFFAQNDSQAQLLKSHFGEEITISIIGLKTNEFFNDSMQFKNEKNYDIVYHGANIEAKGVGYFINLAKIMPEYSFFVPSALTLENLPTNLHHENITWNNRLKEIVRNAKLVMNPSLWSAPVEGALLKSIYFNGNVAGVKTKFGFINDIPDDILLKLSSDIQIAKAQIEHFFKSHDNMKKKSQLWLDEYLNRHCSLEKLFIDLDSA